MELIWEAKAKYGFDNFFKYGWEVMDFGLKLKLFAFHFLNWIIIWEVSLNWI